MSNTDHIFEELFQEIGAKKECYLYEKKNQKTCCKCKKRGIVSFKKKFKTKKNRDSSYPVKYCFDCNVFLLRYDVYLNHKHEWVVLNSDEDLKLLEQKREKRLAKKQKNQIHQRNYKSIKDWKRSIILKNINDRKKKEAENALFFNNTIEEKYEIEIPIDAFVVHCSTFYCRYIGHKLDNVDGIIKILKGNNTFVSIQVPTAYCRDCGTFFCFEQCVPMG